MPVISKLSAMLTLNSSQFKKGLQRASAATKAFAGRVARVGKSIAKFATVGLGVAVAGTLALVKSQFRAIDSLAKVSDKLGITTEELARLRFAAEQTGVASKTLDMALQRMTRRVSEAAMGTGEAKAAIKELGLNAVELAKKSPAEALKDIAEKMQGVKGQSDRVRLAFKLFDSEGVALVNTLMAGREGIEAFGKEADAAGLAISRVDAAKIEAANDAINKLKKLFVGAGRALAIELSPFVTAAANALVAMGTSGEGMGEKVAGAFEKVISFGAKATDFLELIKAGFFNLRGAITKVFAFVVQTIFKAVEKIIELLNKIPGAGKLLGIDTGGIGQAGKLFGDNLAEAAEKNFAKADKAMENFSTGAASKKAEALFDRIKNQSQEMAEASIEAMEDINNKVKESFDPTALNQARADLASFDAKIAKDRASKLAQAAHGVEVKLGRAAIGGVSRGSKKPPDHEQAERRENLLEKIESHLAEQRQIRAA